MSYSTDVNEILRETYIGNATKAKAKFAEMLRATSDSQNRTLLQMMLNLSDSMKTVTDRQRVEWLTSTVRGYFYPPIEISRATDAPWNTVVDCMLQIEPENISTDNYCFTSILKEDNSVFNRICHANEALPIEQNKSIDDCALVSSFINIQVQSREILECKEIQENLYNVNLHFNGSHKRLVTVSTSEIPTTSDKKQLSLYSSQFEHKLLEIAILQVTSGTYTSFGSNVSIDTYRVTGYIPDMLLVCDMSFEMLVKYFNSDTCLVGIGSAATVKNEHDDAIIPHHDYSIIGIDKVKQAILLQDPLDCGRTIKRQFDETFKKDFYQCYLNWNPSKLFKCEKFLTLKYDSNKSNRFDNIGEKPWFGLRNLSTRKQNVWLLLETHLSNSQETRNYQNGEIAYIQEFSYEKVFSKRFPPSSTATNIGLQLVKIELSPSDFKTFFVHSNRSVYFTIHLYSISSQVELSKINPESVISKFAFEWGSETANDQKKHDFIDYMQGRQLYYLNPTFVMSVPSETSKEIHVSLELGSSRETDLLNLQLYAIDDINLSFPIFSEQNYTHNSYVISEIPIQTNTQYMIVASRQIAKVDNEKYSIFLNITENNKGSISDNRAIFDLQRVFLEYGGLPHHCSTTITFPSSKKRHKIYVCNFQKTNEVFLRIKPLENNLIKIRPNVFEKESQEHLCFDDVFHPASFAIQHIKIPQTCESFVILLELEEICRRDLKYTILVGSKRKLQLDSNN